MPTVTDVHFLYVLISKLSSFGALIWSVFFVLACSSVLASLGWAVSIWSWSRASLLSLHVRLYWLRWAGLAKVSNYRDLDIKKPTVCTVITIVPSTTPPSQGSREPASERLLLNTTSARLVVDFWYVSPMILHHEPSACYYLRQALASSLNFTMFRWVFCIKKSRVLRFLLFLKKKEFYFFKN